ncbi:MAG TPA: hypothetical protein VGQ39_13215 [Pyrinomonadaceae bacterium]|nr:hypothetical protein [Pyrinomonadaceae bacterium]
MRRENELRPLSWREESIDDISYTAAAIAQPLARPFKTTADIQM